jgi:oligopeptide/dipeptide ABC transporter ATP-binding protein
MKEPLLSVSELSVTYEKRILAVDGVSFTISSKKRLGLIGESGCGKSTVALSIMRLLPKGTRVVGRIFFENEDILKTSASTMQKIRGGAISMIFQEPRSSLNPVFTIGDQITETIQIHRKVSKREARKGAEELLEKVGMSPEKADSYPHSLSGGMCQRAMIACALASAPRLLIADEPTTSLDVTIQAQIMNLLCRLSEENRMALLFITHDLGIIAEMADYVAVMYAGEIVEYAPVYAIFDRAHHPYTRALLSSMPKLRRREERLAEIGGAPPDPLNIPSGCKFHMRCRDKRSQCSFDKPTIKRVSDNHYVRCLMV